MYIFQISDEAVTQLKMCFSWYAETLTWDPAKYNGLNNLTVSAYEIWLPDVEVFNHVDFTREINYHIYKVRLSSDGMANWCPKVQSTVSCDTDMTHFPHDTHGCVLLIGSATYNFEQIKLKPVLIRDHEVSKSLVRSSNWDIKNVTFQVVKGRVSIDYYDYALHLTIIVKRRFSLHLFSFTLPLFTCAILTFIFCWLPLDDQKRFHLGLLSLILNVYLMTRYSDTLRHSTNTPWGLRFAGDLILFTCSMIVLQILCLTLEDVLIPFATHPSIDRFLSSTFVSSFVLNDHLILVNEEECDTEDTSSQPPPDATQMEVSPRKITEHSTKIGRVNENWRNLLVVIMRISVTLFLFIYAFVYFILDRMFIF